MLTLEARPVVDAMKVHLAERARRIQQARGAPPRLSVILVGDNPASVIYVTQKGKMAVELGMESDTIRLPATATPGEVRKTVDRLNADPLVDGILIQRPLPQGFREEEVIYWVAPGKDVDAFHPENVGLTTLGMPGLQSCTPAGIMQLLRHYRIHLEGRVACVIGRSAIVGKPVASLLLQANATVLHCHSRTPGLRDIARQADILVVAVGKAGFVDSTFVKPGAIVVDVGINRTEEGKVVGDVRFEDVARVASAATPVPRGVGPMTIVMLMSNTLDAAERRAAKSP